MISCVPYDWVGSPNYSFMKNFEYLWNKVLFICQGVQDTEIWLYMTFANLKIKLWYKKAHFIHVHVYNSQSILLIWVFMEETIEGERFSVHCIYFCPVHFNVFSIGLTVVGGMDCTIKVWDIRKGVASSSSQWVHSTHLHY